MANTLPSIFWVLKKITLGILQVIYKIAKAAKVEILNVVSHKFEPQGFTLVALLSESHLVFTHFQNGVISFDFYVWQS